MANMYTDERSFQATVKAEIWPSCDLDNPYKSAVFDLTRPGDTVPTFSFGINSEEEFLELYDQLVTAGSILGWTIL